MRFARGVWTVIVMDVMGEAVYLAPLLSVAGTAAGGQEAVHEAW